MTHDTNNQPNLKRCLPTPLYSPKQVYDIEKAWFDKGYKSYGLMTQAAWQMSQWIHNNIHNNNHKNFHKSSHNNHKQPKACVWTGSGNNGGDGWLIGYFLTQLGWQVSMIEVASSSTEDANKAKNQAIEVVHQVMDFKQWQDYIQAADSSYKQSNLDIVADVYVDALFGIGLDRAPRGNYKLAIERFNQQVIHAKSYLYSDKPTAIAVDVPSGVLARTGQVFESRAIRADITLCLVARKAGLHTKDAMDYCGDIVDFPLIPIDQNIVPQAQLHHAPKPLPQRQHNTHKGSFGHVLIIGGNYELSYELSCERACLADQTITQGMGGAAILAASTAMASGAGKVTVLCHAKFHQAVISSLPNAMVMDLEKASEAVEDSTNQESANKQNKLITFIKQADSVALGMGLGRSTPSYQLFVRYLDAIIQANIPMVIDADGLYHLASLTRQDKQLADKLKQYSQSQAVWFTPHSGEAARLLDKSVDEVEADRFDAITVLAEQYGGCWLLKGAGSLVYDANENSIAICGLGNAGMATAGMGDVLAGHAAAMQVQADLDSSERDLIQVVMIHAMAGDLLANRGGVRSLQAQDMAEAIGEVMQALAIGNPHLILKL